MQADRPAWDALWAGYQQHFNGCVPADVSERSWGMMVDPASGLECLVAQADGAPCGFVHYSFTQFAWTAGPLCFLQDLYVNQAARGHGAGRALVEAVYEAATHVGAANVFWLGNVHDDNLKAFYRQIAVETPYVRFMQKPWAW